VEEVDLKRNIFITQRSVVWNKHVDIK